MDYSLTTSCGIRFVKRTKGKSVGHLGAYEYLRCQYDVGERVLPARKLSARLVNLVETTQRADGRYWARRAPDVCVLHALDPVQRRMEVVQREGRKSADYAPDSEVRVHSPAVGYGGPALNQRWTQVHSARRPKTHLNFVQRWGTLRRWNAAESWNSR
jgi:hypothetical protein